jgi:predicted secreted hydrolase
MDGLLDISKASNVASWRWKIARPGYAWSFPRDHWAHRGYHMEWWYFTGHIEAVDEPDRLFGYQFTVFRIGLMPERPALAAERASTDLLMGHAGISDLSTKEHRFGDLIYRENPMLCQFRDPPDEIIAWSLAPHGTNGCWLLRWNGGGFDFEMKDDEHAMAFCLSTQPSKPLVLQGSKGYIRKGGGRTAASQYYSFTRLMTKGTLTIDGATRRVRGTSWMDKEFGSSQLTEQQVGWDWFSLQLDDGRDLMFYLLRRKDGTANYRNGTLVTADGRAHYLKTSEWSVCSTDSWMSPSTKAIYPMRWTVDLPAEGFCLEVVPEFPDQENLSCIESIPSYWEGAVRVLSSDGKRMGRGYVELTGYGENSRPAM